MFFLPGVLIPAKNTGAKYVDISCHTRENKLNSGLCGREGNAFPSQVANVLSVIVISDNWLLQEMPGVNLSAMAMDSCLESL